LWALGRVQPWAVDAPTPCPPSSGVVLIASAKRFPYGRLGIVTDGSTAESAGGEQAANTLQPDDSSWHATTPNAKVRGAIEALRLVTKWRCVRSHGRSHRFDPCHAHNTKPQVTLPDFTPRCRWGTRHGSVGPRWGRGSLARTSNRSEAKVRWRSWELRWPTPAAQTRRSTKA
jgi:hypothetical protein